MKKSKLEQTVIDTVAPLVASMGYELVDVEYQKEQGRFVLAVFIDRTDGQGVTTDDCEAVSKRLDPVIDQMDISAEPYDFEVSSPGLDRPITTERDFEKAKGELVEVKLYQAVNGKKLIQGMLAGADADHVSLIPAKAAPGEIIKLERAKIINIKRVIIF